MHDIVEPRPGEVLVQERQIADLIDFLRTWDHRAPLLVHCLAGVSRSTAVALIAHVQKTGDPRKSAAELRRASSYAWPNRRIVTLADGIMDLDGELIEALDGMGPADWESNPDDAPVPGLWGYKSGRFTRLRI